MWNGNNRDEYFLLTRINSMSKRKVSFVQNEMDELVKEKENQYVHSHLEDFKDYLNYEILEVYSDGNCLYYCMLFLLKVNNMTVHELGNLLDTSKNLTEKLRENLRDKYIVDYSLLKHYDYHDPPNPCVDQYRVRYLNVCKHFAKYKGDEIQRCMLARYGGNSMFISPTRHHKFQLDKLANQIYKDGTAYVWKTPLQNHNRILEDESLLHILPDSHFTMKLFVRTFNMPAVLLQIDNCGGIDSDPNNGSIACTFTLYIYHPGTPNPHIIIKNNEFPIGYLEHFPIVIITQESMYLDPEDPTKVKFNKNQWHHKILVTEVISDAVNNAAVSSIEDFGLNQMYKFSQLYKNEIANSLELEDVPTLEVGHVI